MTELPTPSQIASWYHSRILRIPHGNQNPTKRYLTDQQVLELFDGKVVIEEKVDGKLSWRESFKNNREIVCNMIEDMTGKHTVHDHVIKYNNLPPSKRILLDSAWYEEGRGYRVMYGRSHMQLLYCNLELISPTLGQIHEILGSIAQSPSHFGSPVIEGLVIKNYGAMRFGKWINDAFEDQLHE